MGGHDDGFELEHDADDGHAGDGAARRRPADVAATVAIVVLVAVLVVGLAVVLYLSWVP